MMAEGQMTDISALESENTRDGYMFHFEQWEEVCISR